MKKNPKRYRFHARLDAYDKSNLHNLAAILGMTESDAVRLAVAYLLDLDYELLMQYAFGTFQGTDKI